MQVALQEIGHQRPRQIGGAGIVSRRARIDVAMAAEGEEVPFEWLAIFFERLIHRLLHR